MANLIAQADMSHRTWAVNGDNYRNAPERVVQRVLRARELTSEGCWRWPYTTSNGGYGRTRYTKAGGKSVCVFVHRLIYTRLVADPGDLMQLDHLCHDPEICLLGNDCPHRRCFNPDHLEPATFEENNLRGRTILAVNSAKTHCPKGHPYDEANTRWYQGQRVCRACNRLRPQRPLRQDVLDGIHAAAKAARVAEKLANPRFCRRCGADISLRNGNAIYCVTCAPPPPPRRKKAA